MNQIILKKIIRTEISPSLVNAPSRNVSRSRKAVEFRRVNITFLICSNRVYCKIGLITSKSAGPSPSKNLIGPSFLMILSIVAMNPSFFMTTFESVCCWLFSSDFEEQMEPSSVAEVVVGVIVSVSVSEAGRDVCTVWLKIYNSDKPV